MAVQDIGHVAIAKTITVETGSRPASWRAGQPVHPWHVDVGDDHVEVAVLGEEGQRAFDTVAGEAESDRPPP